MIVGAAIVGIVTVGIATAFCVTLLLNDVATDWLLLSVYKQSSLTAYRWSHAGVLDDFLTPLGARTAACGR